jgi:hypothetical protein
MFSLRGGRLNSGGQREQQRQCGPAQFDCWLVAESVMDHVTHSPGNVLVLFTHGRSVVQGTLGGLGPGKSRDDQASQE